MPVLGQDPCKPLLLDAPGIPCSRQRVSDSRRPFHRGGRIFARPSSGIRMVCCLPGAPAVVTLDENRLLLALIERRALRALLGFFEIVVAGFQRALGELPGL